jgi:hypothetical protein
MMRLDLQSEARESASYPQNRYLSTGRFRGNVSVFFDSIRNRANAAVTACGSASWRLTDSAVIDPDQGAIGWPF